MTSKRDSDKAYATVALVYGLSTFALCVVSFNNLSNRCTDKRVYGMLTGIMCIGGVMLMGSVTYGFCAWRNECYPQGDRPEKSTLYLSIALLLSVVCIFLLGAIFGRLRFLPKCLPSDTKEELERTRNLKVYLYFLLVINIITALMSGLGIVYVKQWIPEALRLTKEQQGKVDKPQDPMEENRRRMIEEQQRAVLMARAAALELQERQKKE